MTKLLDYLVNSWWLSYWIIL